MVLHLLRYQLTGIVVSINQSNLLLKYFSYNYVAAQRHNNKTLHTQWDLSHYFEMSKQIKTQKIIKIKKKEDIKNMFLIWINK